MHLSFLTNILLAVMYDSNHFTTGIAKMWQNCEVSSRIVKTKFNFVFWQGLDIYDANGSLLSF